MGAGALHHQWIATAATATPAQGVAAAVVAWTVEGVLVELRRSEYRVIVTGLPSSASWQDLKDHMRRAGDVCFAQVFRDGSAGTMGIVDFTNYDDMKYAIRKLDDSEFRNPFSRSFIRVKEDKGYGSRKSASRSPSRSRSKSARSRSPSRSISPRSRSPPSRSRSRSIRSATRSPSRSPIQHSASPLKDRSRSVSADNSRSPSKLAERSLPTGHQSRSQSPERGYTVVAANGKGSDRRASPLSNDGKV